MNNHKTKHDRAYGSDKHNKIGHDNTKVKNRCRKALIILQCDYKLLRQKCEWDGKEPHPADTFANVTQSKRHS